MKKTDSSKTAVTIINAFTTHVVKTPDALALCFGKTLFTYSDLDYLSDSLASSLLDTNVIKPGALLALYTDRSPEFIIGLLAALKVGCVFLPIDSSLPSQRAVSLMNRPQVVAVMTKKGLAGRLTEMRLDKPHVILEDRMPKEVSIHSIGAEKSNSSELAYCIYTSGTSGKPKAVLVKQSSVLNLVGDWTERTAHHSPRRCAWWTAIGFDVGIFEIFSSLLTGACLYPVPERARYDIQTYSAWLRLHTIESAYIPPFLVKELTLSGDLRLPLRSLLVGVEPLDEQDLLLISRNNSQMLILNGYGPTETTVYATVYDDLKDKVRIAPIGKPIANTRVYIMDELLRVVSDGVVGEICVAGAGVAAGYLDDSVLTEERFVDDPISGEGKLYRTGDFGKVLQCGNIAFIGRKDSQIKIAGVRVDLSEIEVAIREHQAVKLCAVGVCGTMPKRLVAYLVVTAGTHEGNNIQEHLVQSLPHYMIPSEIHYVEALPITLNGKIDRAALFGNEMSLKIGEL